MRSAAITSAVVGLCGVLSAASPTDTPATSAHVRHGKPNPKVFLISMFTPEANAWYGISEFDLLARNITVPGFSPLFPEAHCTANGEICQLVTGEGEINAAVTVTALYSSRLFDLSETYFLVGGIAGISPEQGTLASVTFARFAVQVALQYEFDYREVPQDWSTGYVPQDSFAPGEYPSVLYGTEVFELNDALRQLAIQYASTAKLNDSDVAAAYRANYNTPAYAAAALPPSVLPCDTATSDVYFSGDLLGAAFANFTSVLTNGTSIFCTSQQEDNATLEALLRGGKAGLLDFARIIVMRTASDFDRPYPGQSPLDNLLYAHQGGHDPAVHNIYLAGVKVVEGILDNWNSRFRAGIEPTNYVGDIFGTLGGEPDFGPGNRFERTVVASRRNLKGVAKRGIIMRAGI
ncbi:putative purine nucleoside permease [Auricularia subglabra TFB-10046 SS5]|nr:putative purine nucleoside permease [Auricularia subglabra TFB-10046 SS5]